MNRMILQKLIVYGVSYRRTINFNEDFTIISGEKTSGKSLILSLIDFCLGKKNKIDLSVQPELDAKCDQIFLELRINDEIITLKRLLKEKHTKISIYFCPFERLDEYTPKTLEIKEAMQVLMQKLNLNEYKIIRYQKHSNKKEIDTVSFRDIFRYVYIHQHELGTGDFLEKKNTFKSNKNPHAFKMMFNLVDVDKDTLSEQLVRIQNEIEETRKTITGLNSYLKDLDAEELIVLQAKSDKLVDGIEKQKQAKATLIRNRMSRVIEKKGNNMYIKIKQDFESLSNDIFDYQREKRHLQLSISSKKLLLEEYKVEQQEVDETLYLNYTLVIPDQSIECPLCRSKVVSNNLHEKVHQSTNVEKTLQKVQKEIINKIGLVNDFISNEVEKIEEIDKEIARLSRKQEVLKDALAEFAKETEVPFLPEIDSMNVIMNKMIKDHEVIKEGLRIHHKIDEKNSHINELNAAEKRLNKEIESLKMSEEDKNIIFSYLDSEYKKFMKRLKYNTTGETFIHKDQYIPYYNGASVYAHESGGLLECMQLAYLGAILKSKTKGYATGHPGLLLLDSISKYVGTLQKSSHKIDQSQEQLGGVNQARGDENGEKAIKINDPEVYEEFFKVLIELSRNHQIILVENTPPEKFDSKYTKYTFYEGQNGLIDEEENELNDIDVV